jgi:hypothetical protein
VKPLFTDEERAQANKNFIVARYHHKANISSFYPIVHYLEDGLIKPLCKLSRSGASYPIYENKQFLRYENYYNEHDAEIYFEWLVAVVSGAEPTSEEVIRQANDQLFQFLHILEGHIDIDRNVQLLAPYDWQTLFKSFDKELTAIKDTVEHHDKAIVDVLKSILKLLAENKKLLETLQEEYDSFPQGVSP